MHGVNVFGRRASVAGSSESTTCYWQRLKVWWMEFNDALVD